MKDRKSQSAIPAEAPPHNYEHVNRIVQKMREGGSTSADIVMTASLSINQSRKARHSRRDDLQELIIVMARDNLEITANRLFYELKNRVDQGVIVSMTANDTVEWKTSEGKLKKTPVSGLKDRLSRAKKYLKKDSL